MGLLAGAAEECGESNQTTTRLISADCSPEHAANMETYVSANMQLGSSIVL